MWYVGLYRTIWRQLWRQTGNNQRNPIGHIVTNIWWIRIECVYMDKNYHKKRDFGNSNPWLSARNTVLNFGLMPYFFIFEVVFRTYFRIHIFAIAVWPLFLPLSGDGGVNEAFHALGTFALHAVGHMTVNIQCKSSRMMPEILLYGLGIVTGLKRDGGKCMP